VESINRLNNYQNDSSCMRRLRGRKFCICKSQILENHSTSEVTKLIPNKNKIDDKLYELPDMRENDQNIETLNIEVISV